MQRENAVDLYIEDDEIIDIPEWNSDFLFTLKQGKLVKDQGLALNLRAEENDRWACGRARNSSALESRVW